MAKSTAKPKSKAPSKSPSKEARKIVITRDGPDLVHGDVPLNQARIERDASGAAEAWAVGEPYAPEHAPYALCRCGRSRTKPFCDGTHEDCEFRGRESADREPYAEHAQLQEGETVDMLDDESLCVGATFCDRGATVWRLVDESGDPGNRDLAIQEACACPAGRLTIVEKDGTMLEPKLPAEISLVEDEARDCRGPLWVKGGIPLEGADGEQYETRNRMALCRCGESSNMPFCDASHFQCKYMAGLDRPRA